MAAKREVEVFVKSQKSIRFYKDVQCAFSDVLSAMSTKDFKFVTKNLILMVLHEAALGQVMHFPASGDFRVLQLTVPKRIPAAVLRYVVAHELGHVMQDRNWKKSDAEKLETDADATAARWGFPKTPAIKKWIDRRRASRNN